MGRQQRDRGTEQTNKVNITAAPGTVAAAVRTVLSNNSTAPFLRGRGDRTAFEQLRSKLQIVGLGRVQTNLEIVAQGDAALQMSELALDVFLFTPNFTRDGQMVLHKVAERVLSPGHMGLLVALDSPIYDLVNAFALRCVEAGLPAHCAGVGGGGALAVQGLRAQRRRLPSVAAEQTGGEAKQRPWALCVELLAGPLLCLGAAVLAWMAEMLWGWSKENYLETEEIWHKIK
ncbi:Protein of unknown function [Gryllus bimaculatus]|nr:Protein of unknown function [Gryllus bimaculatus]